ncbi:putative autism susceptibility 2 protein [Scophthalmus maximus]|uniref:Putative autism susceptibility 2 protein n=1 Tax=Scophthalmus maximus TaxID=52904 RepID=A0A2U9B948_SCOMX|nr:putative autism susceptibility 2 protein [Scophthalmus maximus]
MIAGSSKADCMADKNISLKPQECSDNQAGPLHKKKPVRVPNGMSLETCKNNHHHQQPSDQENNPRLAHTQGKRKKKRLNKKHSTVR